MRKDGSMDCEELQKLPNILRQFLLKRNLFSHFFELGRIWRIPVRLSPRSERFNVATEGFFAEWL
jgi:hypothetical protein